MTKGIFFIAGYDDKRIFEDFRKDTGETLFDENVKIYELDELLKHPAIENCVQMYEETSEDFFFELSNEEQADYIMNYIKHDEIFCVLKFDTLEEANKELELIKEDQRLLREDIESGIFKFTHYTINELGESLPHYELDEELYMTMTLKEASDK